MAKRHRIPGMGSDRTLYVLPAIADSLDPEIKNALAIRNATSTSGICPDCGATGRSHRNPGEPENVWHITFAHEPECAVLADGASS